MNKILQTIRKKLLPFIGAVAMIFWQQDLHASNLDPLPDSLAEFRAAVEADLENMDLHKALIKAAGRNSPLLVKEYDAWIKANPKSAILPLAIGTALYQRELPNAKPYLVRVTELDPKKAEAWFMLSIDASRWGDEDAAMDYMRKASEAAPDDAGYAFYYAMDFEEKDGKEWRKKLYALAKRFPDNERGAQGLYWLATRSHDPKEKIEVYEKLRNAYPPEKFSWSASGMSGLYDAYLESDVAKAIALAEAMGEKSGWPVKLTAAKHVKEVQGLLKAGKNSEAAAIATQIKVPRFTYAADFLHLTKAKAYAAAGKLQEAYDSLQLAAALNPTDKLNQALTQFGKQLGRSESAITADTWTLRNKQAYTAPAFLLDQYLKPGQASLDDFKGKVVLLTFWFPGCGPCRGEFPHFENVLKKFSKDEVAYIGINVLPDQDEYVVPFMNSTGYTFLPLRATNEWAMETYKVRGQPTNFMIDQNGQVVFANFRTDGSNERTLELMIADVLKNRK